MTNPNNPLSGTAYVTNNDLNSVSVVDLETKTITGSIQVGSNPYDLVFTKNGKTAYVTNYGSKNVSVIDVVTNKEKTKIGVGIEPCGIALNPVGNKVFVACLRSNTVTVISVASNTILKVINLAPYVASGGENQIAFNKDGSRIYVSDFTNGMVTILNGENNTRIGDIELGTNQAMGMLVNNLTGDLLVCNFGSGINPEYTISVINQKSLKIEQKITVGKNPSSIAQTSDGTRLYVTNTLSHTVSVIQVSQDSKGNNYYKVSDTVKVGLQPVGAFVNQDNTYVFICNSASNSLSIIDVSSHDVETIEGFNSPYDAMPIPTPKLKVEKLESPATDKLNDVIYANGSFRAVGEGGTVLMSDGLGDNWSVAASLRVKGAREYPRLKGLTYSNGMYVAVGQTSPENNDTFYSQDAKTWKEMLVDKNEDSNYAVLTENKDLYIVSHASVTKAEINNDSISIVNQYIVDGGTESLELITSNGTILVCGGPNGATVAPLSGFGGKNSPFSPIVNPPSNLKALSYSPQLKKFVGLCSAGSSVTSTDGLSWSKQFQMKAPGKNFNGLAWDSLNQWFIAVGSNGLIRKSEDGETWEIVNYGSINALQSVSCYDGICVAVGDAGEIVKITVE